MWKRYDYTMMNSEVKRLYVVILNKKHVKINRFVVPTGAKIRKKFPLYPGEGQCLLIYTESNETFIYKCREKLKLLDRLITQI